MSADDKTGPASAARLGAQSCDSTAHPCINQAQAGDKKITGRLHVGADGTVPSGTSVEVKLKGISIGSPEWNSDGTFSKDLAKPMNSDDSIEVDQFPDASGGTAKATVVEANATCDKKVTPCITQPYSGDTQIVGTAGAGATVDVTVNGVSVGSATVNTDGTFSRAGIAPLSSYDKVRADQNLNGAASTTGEISVIASQTLQEEGKNTLFTRSTLGIQMAAANGASPSTKLFADFYVTAPLWGGHNVRIPKNCNKPSNANASAAIGQERLGGSADDNCRLRVAQANLKRQFRNPLDTRVWAFFNPRLTTVNQSNIALGSVAPPSSTIFQNAGTTDLTKLVQSFEMEQGLEVRLAPFGRWMPDTIGDIRSNGGTRVALFGYGSYGVGVPLTGQQAVSTVYVANSTINAIYGAPSSAQYIAVVENTKDRFYRNFYVGLRLKTFGYDLKQCDVYAISATAEAPQSRNSSSGAKDGVAATPMWCPLVRNEFPGVFDVAWGQDDSINGQRLNGGVVRMQAFYPLPFYKAAHLFGGVRLSLTHKDFINNTQFVLAPSNITPTSTGVFQVGVNPPARDQYSFGIGVDLIEVWKQHLASQKQQQTPAAKPQT